MTVFRIFYKKVFFFGIQDMDLNRRAIKRMVLALRMSFIGLLHDICKLLKMKLEVGNFIVLVVFFMVQKLNLYSEMQLEETGNVELFR